jgi:hypothetical protein
MELPVRVLVLEPHGEEEMPVAVEALSDWTFAMGLRGLASSRGELWPDSGAKWRGLGGGCRRISISNSSGGEVFMVKEFFQCRQSNTDGEENEWLEETSPLEEVALAEPVARKVAPGGDEVRRGKIEKSASWVR